MSVSVERKTRSYTLVCRMGNSDSRHTHQSILGILPKVDIIRIIYRNGMDLRTCIHSDTEFIDPGRIRVAIGWRYHIYYRGRYLCTETSYI